LTSARFRKHGMKGSPEYRTWKAMKTRCFNPNSQYFSCYGGRNITVCERWANSFESFYADMGPKPGPGYSIERKDNSLGYAPSNCRWATAKEQRAKTTAGTSRVKNIGVLDPRPSSDARDKGRSRVQPNNNEPTLLCGD
jgi:hypothetical protein